MAWLTWTCLWSRITTRWLSDCLTLTLSILVILRGILANTNLLIILSLGRGTVIYDVDLIAHDDASVSIWIVRRLGTLRCQLWGCTWLDRLILDKLIPLVGLLSRLTRDRRGADMLLILQWELVLWERIELWWAHVLNGVVAWSSLFYASLGISLLLHSRESTLIDTLDEFVFGWKHIRIFVQYLIIHEEFLFCVLFANWRLIEHLCARGKIDWVVLWLGVHWVRITLVYWLI